MQHYGDHEHIYGCYEALWDKDYLYIVMLQARHGDLFQHIHWHPNGEGYIRRDDVPHVARQLVKNLEFLQERHLVHRDLKPENVLVTVQPWVPFMDFAMMLQIPYLKGRPQMILNKRLAVSPFYLSPEVLNSPFDHKADIWAFGWECHIKEQATMKE